MSHISKKQLDTKTKNSIQNDFKYLLTNEKNRFEIFNDLLTETERIMLAKRFAVVLLLNKKIPQHIIAEKLKVSKSTVLRLNHDYSNGRFSSFINNIKKSKEKERDILKKLERILTLGMPQYASKKERWEWMNSLIEK